MLPSGSVQGEVARLKLRQEDRKQAAGVTGVGGGGEAVRGGGGEEGGGPGDTSPAGGRVQPPPPAAHFRQGLTTVGVGG